MKYTEEEKKTIESSKAILEHWQEILDIEDDIERDIEMSMYSEEMPFNEMKILLNLIEKQQKEIEIKDKRINALQRIIEKDLPTNQAYISTFCGIPIEEAMDMIEICKTQTIHLNDQEYKKVVELAQKDCIPKEEIKKLYKKYNDEYTDILNKINIKVAHMKDEHKIRATYAEFGVAIGKTEALEELLGE